MKRLMMGFVMDDRKVEEKWKFVPEPAFCYIYPEDRTLDHFFDASHIRHNFPYNLIPISIS